jgi:hypothetical protein
MTQTVHAEAIATRVRLDGVDVSLQFLEFVVSDAYLSESGLITTTGSLDLADTGGPLSFDDWEGIQWLRVGTSVSVEVNFGAGWVRHPRGALVIQGTRFSEESDAEGRISQGTQVEVACLLAARNFDNDVISELDLSPGGTAHSQIEALFQLAGCGNVTWGPGTGNDFAFIGRPRLDGTYISTAGKLLASLGLFAWIDGLGNLRVDAESNTPIWALTRSGLIDYERVLVGDRPRPIARGQATYREFRGLPGSEPTQPDPVIAYGDIGAIVPEASGWGPVSAVQSWEWVNAGTWQIIKRRREQRLGFNVFGGRNGTPRATLVTAVSQTITEQYQPPELGGKLLWRKEESVSPIAAVLRGYCDWAILNSKPVSLSTEVMTFKLAKYSYDDRDRLVEIIQESSEAVGTTLSSLNPDWEVVFGRWGQPSQTQIAYFELRQWLEKTPGRWEFNQIQRYPLASEADGNNGFQTRIAEAKTNSETANLYSQAIAPGAVKITPNDSGSGQAQPPEPERWPSDSNSSEQRQIQEDVIFDGFASGWAPQIQSYTMPFFPDLAPPAEPSRARLRDYTAYWHRVALRRWKSVRVELPLTAERLNYKPYASVDLQDFRHDYRLLLNGTTWRLTPESAALSSDCSLLGQIFRSAPSGPVTAVVPPNQIVIDLNGGVQIGGSAVAAAIVPAVLPVAGGTKIGATMPVPRGVYIASGGVRVSARVRVFSAQVDEMLAAMQTGGYSIPDAEAFAFNRFILTLGPSLLAKHKAIWAFPGTSKETQKYALAVAPELGLASQYSLSFGSGNDHSIKGVSRPTVLRNETNPSSAQITAPFYNSNFSAGSIRYAFWRQPALDDPTPGETGELMGVGYTWAPNNFRLRPSIVGNPGSSDSTLAGSAILRPAGATTGLLTINRIGTNLSRYHNGSLETSWTDAVGNSSHGLVRLFPLGNGRGFCSLAAVSDGLTAAEELVFYNAAAQLMIDLGRI